MNTSANYTKEMIDAVQEGSVLPVMEYFYTIQGEGFHSGVPCYFIRLAGCDVGCIFCDVKESWEKENHPLYSIEEILVWVSSTKATKVVVTGGEPLMHQLDRLCALFQGQQIDCHIETSGAHPYSGYWDWFTLSPKKRKLPLEENYAKADELKIIISRVNDFLFAEQQAEKVSSECKLYLQPEWSKESEILNLIIEYIKEHPDWNISLQTHKYMNIP
jgi:organic radical activating enzyme